MQLNGRAVVLKHLVSAGRDEGRCENGQATGACVLRHLREVDGLACGVSTGAQVDGHPSGGIADRPFEDPLLLLDRERPELTGGACPP